MSGNILTINDERAYEEAVRRGGVTIAVFMRGGRRVSRYFSMVVEDLAWKMRATALFLLVDVDKLPGLAMRENVALLPALRLYVNGRCVWEQEGCFMDYEKDMLVLRRSIREALRAEGLDVRI